MLKKIKNIIEKNLSLIFRFSLSGLFFNLVGFIFYVILSDYFRPFLSLLISYPVIIITYFFFQNFYVFKIKKFQTIKLIKFFLNSFFLLFVNTILLFVATEVFYLEHKISQFMIMIFLTIINFIVQKKIFNS